jgi:hypothetical protein
MHGGFVADGELVISGGHSAVALERRSRDVAGRSREGRRRGKIVDVMPGLPVHHGTLRAGGAGSLRRPARPGPERWTPRAQAGRGDHRDWRPGGAAGGQRPVHLRSLVPLAGPGGADAMTGTSTLRTGRSHLSGRKLTRLPWIGWPGWWAGSSLIGRRRSTANVFVTVR